MVSNTLFASNTEERYTPKDFFEEIDKEFHFTLDPCATKENHKCEKFYTKEDDGLKQNRDNEIVFCNPPYGKEIKKRVEKGSLARGGDVVMLLPARTDTQRFHNFIYGKAEIRFIKGRLKFGGAKNSAPFPSMLAIFRSIKQNDSNLNRL